MKGIMIEQEKNEEEKEIEGMEEGKEEKKKCVKEEGRRDYEEKKIARYGRKIRWGEGRWRRGIRKMKRLWIECLKKSVRREGNKKDRNNGNKQCEREERKKI